MNLRTCLIVSCVVSGLAGFTQQSAGNASAGSSSIVNVADSKWEHGPSGSESVTLREDPATGATELFARYPAGHVFPPHWHSSNERVMLIEGRMSIRDGGAGKFLDAGGFAFLPAKVPQEMACVSATRCSFYLYWDGRPDSHKIDSSK